MSSVQFNNTDSNSELCSDFDLNSSWRSYKHSNVQINVIEDEETNSPGRPVTIILLGKSGHGKSASANSIVGNDVFTSCSSENVTTLKMQQEETVINQRQVTVIDTPDPNHFSREDANHLKKLTCVLVLVIRCGTRMTKEEQTAINKIRTLFGHDSFRKRGIILLTHCDLFPLARIRNDLSLLDSDLLEEFEKRVVFLNNKEENHLVQVTQITDFLLLIDETLQKYLVNNNTQKTSLSHWCCCRRNKHLYVMNS